MSRAGQVEAVALDTEFVWERTYFPRLGLIQLALSKEECFLIDPCALTDLSPLGELLANPAIMKILHDAPQDLFILSRATGVETQNIFDTRLAAGFAGLSSTLSLAALIEVLLGIKLKKTETRTNWLKRPLHPRQEEYAQDDVRYLRALRLRILDRTTPKARKWLAEELQRLDSRQSYNGIADQDRYLKIRGSDQLDRRSLAILQQLAIWREQEARKRNRPRGHIVRDGILLAMASQQVQDQRAIQNCGEISAKSVASHGPTLIKIVNKALQLPEKNYPASLRKTRLNSEEARSLGGIQAFIAQQGESLGVDPILVGNKAELQELVRSPGSPGRQGYGWRQQLLGELIPVLAAN